MSRRLIEFIDWVARVHFIGTMAWGGGGWAVTFFATSANGWDVSSVWLASLVGGACCALIFIAFKTKGGPLAVPAASKPERIVEADLSLTEAYNLPQPDIDPREAFRQILESSRWAREQRRTTTNTQHLLYDWLEIRLKTEIHKYLRNSLLSSWGEECLSGTATTPEKPIPPETWDKVEILFDRLEFPRAAAHWKGPTSREIGRMAWIAVKFSNEQIFKLFPLVDNAQLESRIPLHEAARLAYEAAEEADVLKLTTSSNSSPDTKLRHFKFLFMVDDETQLFGVKPPSTKSRPLSKADLMNLCPADGDVSHLNSEVPQGVPVYVDVTVQRKDLQRVIDGYIAEAKRYAK